MLDDWVTVIPESDAVKETARALLDLAASPQDVRTAGTGTEFLIPPYLAELYNKPKRRRVKKEEGEE